MFLISHVNFSKLLDAIKTDYTNKCGGNPDCVVTVNNGRKYHRIDVNGEVWGFVVKDDFTYKTVNFKAGDLLRGVPRPGCPKTSTPQKDRRWENLFAGGFFVHWNHFCGQDTWIHHDGATRKRREGVWINGRSIRQKNKEEAEVRFSLSTYDSSYYQVDGDPFDPNNEANWDHSDMIGFRSRDSDSD